MPDPSSPSVVRGIGGLSRELGRLLIVVGVFDGLHRGHAYLLRRLVREARARAARPTVLTFDAHPDAIVRGEAPPLLLDPEERLVRLAAAGVEVCVVVHFDDTLRHTPYDAFVGSIVDRVELAGFMMTPDAAFGYERRGTPEALARLASSAAGIAPFEVVVVPPYLLGGRPVRSSDVRSAVGQGRLADARRLLGRRHAVTGAVDRSGEVAFEVPVALPPPGIYEAQIGRAWSLDVRPSRSVRRVRAAVEHAVIVEGRGAGAAPGRARIAFRGRAG